MIFNQEPYTVEETALFGQTIRYRAWRNIPYVETPVIPEYQRLNLFAPEALFAGECVNGYTLDTAPVFVPNTVGGYMPGALDGPGEDRRRPGQAPACIVDYKAAVRWLHYFAADLPGDAGKIIANGTSAGGALSALMGASGNHPDYEPICGRSERRPPRL